MSLNYGNLLLDLGEIKYKLFSIHVYILYTSFWSTKTEVVIKKKIVTWSRNFTKHKKPLRVLYWMSIFLQEEVTLVGRICCDSLGKMNAKSVILEGSRDTSAGRSVPLDLSDLKQYSLFPGQVRIYIQYISTVSVKCLKVGGGVMCF